MTVLDQLMISNALDEGWGCPCPVVVGEDPHGELLDFALEAAADYPGGPHVYLAATSFAQAQRARRVATERGQRDQLVIRGIDGPLDLPEFLGDLDFHFVLTHLPTSLEGLNYIARAVSPAYSACLIAGANNKYLSRNHNEILGESFNDVRASLGKGKFRCLIAEGPEEQTYSPIVQSTGYGTLTGIGSCFGGAKIDRGGELLATTIAPLLTTEKVLDLGCGNGLVSLILSKNPDLSITACDIHADAVLSAQQTLSGLDIGVVWDDAGSSLPTHSFDAIALNPPFHSNSEIDTSQVDHLLDRAHQLLVPGGTLYLVFNSHLRYQRHLSQWNNVTELARNPKFTVLSAQV